MLIAVAIEILAALCALVTGALFLASTFALRALRDVPAADRIRTMNAINLATAKPIKRLVSGAALPCLVAAPLWFLDWSWDRLEERGALMAIAGGVIYGLGVILVTIERSVPLNKFLGTATDASSDMIWRIYQRDWGLWNLVRITACTAAGALLVAAVVMHTVHAIDSGRRMPSPIESQDDFRWPDDCPYCSQAPDPKRG
jgi:uncharacterized membrane protein